jgi:flagellin-like hook-associated protein FlgL
MSSDVVLTAAMRTNLLSLQGTQSVIDLTQNRLATGRKVNSALDNPQSFFASQALNNRASDLTRLLDSIGQSIQVIKAADNGITALTKLVEQADSIASQAQDALAQGTAEAKVVGNKDLRGINDLTSVPGIVAADEIILSLTDDDGNAVQIAPYGVNGAANATIAFAANMSTDQLLAAINDLRINTGTAGTPALGDQAFEAKLNDKGYLEIRSLNGGNFRAVFEGTGGLGTTDTADLALASALGFGNVARSAGDTATAGTTTTVEFTAIADVALTSFTLVKNTNGDLADRSTLLSAILNGDAAGFPALSAGIDNAGDDYTIAINGGSRQIINLTTAAGVSLTVQDFIDQINNNTTLNSKIEASFDESTGQLSIKAIDAGVTSVEVGFDGNTAGDRLNWGFGNATLQTVTGAADVRENIQLGAASGQLAKLEQDFDKIRDQIDLLVEDTGYRGTNLLKGDDLLTVFNEFRTSSITTTGVEFTASGLGIEEADFSRASAVSGMLAQVRSALESVRDFGTTLANDLSVIQTRQTFTTELINTLKAGSDALTVADQNEEGAKLLALQTRQQLGVTSLSLASQSQQSILRLF